MKLLLLLLSVCVLGGLSNTQENGTQNAVLCPYSEPCTSIRECSTLRQSLHGLETNANLRKRRCGTSDNGTPKICCPGSERMIEPNSLFAECGISNSLFRRFTFTTEAILGAWPWMVALNYRSLKNSTTSDFKCSATLIAEQWLITAAHCVREIGNKWEIAFARLGYLDLNDRVEDNATVVDVQIDRIVSHPQYSTRPLVNDIALIHLKNPVKFSAYIRPICLLSKPEHKRNEYYLKKKAFLTDWNVWRLSEPSHTKLQEWQIPIENHEKCAKKYISANKTFAVIDDRIICGQKRQEKACESGATGPLTFLNSTEHRFYLGGIGSFEIRCADEYPSVFTKVAHFIDWINDVTGEKF